VLRYLTPNQDVNVLVGGETADDAGVYRLNPETGLVATVDFFTPIVDEPYAFGQIAAANALSDVYAMGGTPLFALNVAGFPREGLPLEILGQILRGGQDKAREAGVPVIGGHTIDDAEPKYGLVVVGQVAPDRIIRNVGARPGDRLFLTKPLGVGIIATAIKREIASAEQVARVVELMGALNRAASEAMLTVQPHAATDVTGFGLLGHLWEMASGSGVGAFVDVDRVPVLPEAWLFAHDGIVPGGTRRNLAALEGRVVWGPGIDEPERLVLADAQTSGGLLIAVSPREADAFRDALVRIGTPVAAEIGAIVEGDRIVVRHNSER
jgi:selenide,water dikinase